jgi:hypothetical protein
LLFPLHELPGYHIGPTEFTDENIDCFAMVRGLIGQTTDKWFTIRITKKEPCDHGSISPRVRKLEGVMEERDVNYSSLSRLESSSLHY